MKLKHHNFFISWIVYIIYKILASYYSVMSFCSEWSRDNFQLFFSFRPLVSPERSVSTHRDLLVLDRERDSVSWSYRAGGCKPTPFTALSSFIVVFVASSMKIVIYEAVDLFHLLGKTMIVCAIKFWVGIFNPFPSSVSIWKQKF